MPCWAFATFDGHAGPACAHYLKENFMVGDEEYSLHAEGGWDDMLLTPAAGCCKPGTKESTPRGITRDNLM